MNGNMAAGTNAPLHTQWAYGDAGRTGRARGAYIAVS